MRKWPLLSSLFILFRFTPAQINLGSFNLGRGANGDLLLGFGQGGSLFGFGGDRALQVTIGPGRFGANSGGGLTLNGERLGIDSILGIDEQRGLNLGSFLNSGAPRVPAMPAAAAVEESTERRAPPSAAAAEAGGLGGFLHSIMRAFTPPSAVGRVPATPVEAGGRAERPWPTGAPLWPTPPPPALPTTTPLFPTLLPNAWNRREEGGEDGSGQWVSGVDETGGFSVGPGSTPKRITTEGGGRSTGESRPPVDERSGVNSGESFGSSSSRPKSKPRLGPPPPDGMVDIDAAEAKRRRT
ncbi:hypothetical protein M3Y99_00444300 [Aphelenchoides fujianensis]|nr:hypothetical protein M3Y99_00444300 [Aphelenchoides fujianensis]